MKVEKKLQAWITYAWTDNEEGDFGYLVKELESIGVIAKYDRVCLKAGRDLWEQIGDKITTSNIDGWCYLVTENSLVSEACREELSYALKRVKGVKSRLSTT
jgi:hypothetical protein